MASAPNLEPSSAPVSNTANVCIVTGTGVNGNGTATCAASAVNKLKATTSATPRAQSIGASKAPANVSTLAFWFIKKSGVWSLESGVWSQRQKRDSVLTPDSRLQTPDLN